MKIARFLKEARLAKHLTQKEVAEQVGSHQQNIASYETGRSFPPLNTLKHLIELYELDPFILLELKAPQSFKLPLYRIEDPYESDEQKENRTKDDALKDFFSMDQVVSYVHAEVQEPEHCFCVTVPDNSIRAKRLCKGDMAVFNRQKKVTDGDIVLVTLENGQTVIRLYKQADGGYFLLATNPEIEITFVPENTPDQVVIRGVLTNLLIDYEKRSKNNHCV